MLKNFFPQFNADCSGFAFNLISINVYEAFWAHENDFMMLEARKKEENVEIFSNNECGNPSSSLINYSCLWLHEHKKVSLKMFEEAFCDTEKENRN